MLLVNNHPFLSHPIQTAQVLHQVFISSCVVVDDGVLFVYTARLNREEKPEQQSAGIWLKQVILK